MNCVWPIAPAQLGWQLKSLGRAAAFFGFGQRALCGGRQIVGCGIGVVSHTSVIYAPG